MSSLVMDGEAFGLVAILIVSTVIVCAVAVVAAGFGAVWLVKRATRRR